MGASAGGVEVLLAVVRDLPRELDAAVCVVLHISATGRSLLADILARSSRLPVVMASDGAAIERGTVYVATADHHLLIRRGHIELSRGPKENRVRPAVDPLLRSLAASWGRRGIAVVLSGGLDDGSAGAAAVVAAGGRLVVQDPDEAVARGMPTSAIAAAEPDAILPTAEIARQLIRMTATPNPDQPQEGDMSSEPDPAQHLASVNRPEGPPSGFTCPECRGPLWEIHEGEAVRYRCRVGHAYSEQSMIEAQGDSVETALWTALEVLQERSELLTRIADRLDERGPRKDQHFRERARHAAERAEVIRRALAIGDAPAEETG